MSFFQTLFGLSSGAKAAKAQPDAEWYLEMKANQARASALRGKILAALNDQGITAEVRAHIEPELLLAALLLGVKSGDDCFLCGDLPCIGHGDKKPKG